MDDAPRRLRADAERNRRRLIAAATEMIAEHGIDVGVGEIAERAGVGRGTLFRHFPSKEALVTAVMVARIEEAAELGRARLDETDARAALFAMMDEFLERQRTDRTLVEALADTWMAHPEIRVAHQRTLEITAELLRRAQAAGTIRDDVGEVDLMLMVKGVCEAARAFQHVEPAVAERQLDLVKAAVSVSTDPAPLRGRPPTVADLERAELAAVDDARTAIAGR